MANPNGWQEQHAAQKLTRGARMRRIHRRKALARGEADPIFQPFSKQLAPEFQAAIDEALARPGFAVTRLPMVSAETARLLERTVARASDDGLEALGKAELQRLFARATGKPPAVILGKRDLVRALRAAKARGSVVELIAAE